MTFARLNRGDVVAFVAALCVLLVLPLPWYSTKQAEQLRHDAGQFVPQIDTQETPSLSQQARQAAAAQEKNAWRADGAVDRLLLVAILAAVVLTIGGAFARAAGWRPRSALTPSQLSSFAGLAAVALLVYRILEPPGLHAAAVVKAGPALALVCMGALTIGARVAAHGEAAERPLAASAPQPREAAS